MEKEEGPLCTTTKTLQPTKINKTKPMKNKISPSSVIIRGLDRLFHLGPKEKPQNGASHKQKKHKHTQNGTYCRVCDLLVIYLIRP